MLQLTLFWCFLQKINIFYCLSLSPCKILFFKIFILVVRRHLRIFSLLMGHQLVFRCRISNSPIFMILKLLQCWLFFNFRLNDDAIKFGSPIYILIIIWSLLLSYFLSSNVSERFVFLIWFILFSKKLRSCIFLDAVQRSVIIYILFRCLSIWN
jgi:hypothetical protein